MSPPQVVTAWLNLKLFNLIVRPKLIDNIACFNRRRILFCWDGGDDTLNHDLKSGPDLWKWKKKNGWNRSRYVKI